MTRLRHVLVVLALLSALAPTAAGAVGALAVLAVDDLPGPDPALAQAAAQVRAALAERAAGVLDADELRQRMTGRPSATPVAALDRAYADALALHAKGDFEGSIRALRALVQDLEQAPPDPDVHAQWKRAMLRLARSEQAVGRRAEAQALLERLLRVEPDAQVDAALYPPGFVSLVDEVRAQVRALWTRRLTVLSSQPVRVLVEGREVGTAPATLDLPPGQYRVSGQLGGVQAHEVLVDLARGDRTVQLDLSVAEAFRPDAGPGLALPASADRSGRVLATASWLGLDRVVAVTAIRRGEEVWIAAALYDVRLGSTEREGRVKLRGGALPPGAVGALAVYLLGGERAAPVELPPSLAAAGAAEPIPGLQGLTAAPEGPPSKAMGWTAIGTGALAVVLGTVAVIEGVSAKSSYDRARGMTDGAGNLQGGATYQEYAAAMSGGDSARTAAWVTGVGACAAAVATGILGYLSWDQTGEVGPFRF